MKAKEYYLEVGDNDYSPSVSFEDNSPFVIHIVFSIINKDFVTFKCTTSTYHRFKYTRWFFEDVFGLIKIILIFELGLDCNICSPYYSGSELNVTEKFNNELGIRLGGIVIEADRSVVEFKHDFRIKENKSLRELKEWRKKLY